MQLGYLLKGNTKPDHLLQEQLLHLSKHALQLLDGGLVAHHPGSLDFWGKQQGSGYNGSACV